MLVKRLQFNTFRDKVRGGWFGKCLGGSAGAPVEGFKKVEGISGFREIIDVTLPNDDLDIQLLWVELLQKRGPYFDMDDMAALWKEKCTYFFSEYGYFMKNYSRGIRPPYSGGFNNPFFKEGMGCPIRSEIWGMVFPGNPDRAADYARMDGQLDHQDNSVWGEMYLAAAESLAFFESDMYAVLKTARRFIPEDSKLARCLAAVDADYFSGRPWEETAERIRRQFGHPDFTNSVQNLGFTELALLYGGGDMEKTLNLALFCGADTDCTCASAGALLGILKGYDAMPQDLRDMVKDSFVIGIPVERTDNTLTALTEDTLRIACGIAQNTAFNPELTFEDMPASFAPLGWEKPAPAVTLTADYPEKPAIGREDRTAVTLTLSNPLAVPLAATLTLTSDNPDIVWDVPQETLWLAAGETRVLTRVASTGAIDRLPQTNLTRAAVIAADGEEVASCTFGLAGAWLFTVYGPFCDQMRSVQDYTLPPCHGEGCNLPTLEAMVNNEVMLDKPYLDEEALIAGRQSAENEACRAGFVNAYEDLIPLDDCIHMEGQLCCYLTTSVWFTEETQAWLVIGHNDGYRLYVNGEPVLEKDEIRFWTPYNSVARLMFRKGENRIVIKALKRTEHYLYSIGIRTSRPNRYHHACPWHTDLVTGLPQTEVTP